MDSPLPRNERGIALITALLVGVVLSAIVLAVVMMTLNAVVVGKNTERSSVLDAVALSGLEEARSRLNGDRSLLPLSGYVTLENNAAVKDAGNLAIPKVTRSVYAGPVGMVTSQYGKQAAIIAVARDSFGNTAVRRLDVNQESFAKFAYFTNSERDTLGGTIWFGGGDQIRGPLFTNDTIKIAPSGATFFDKVQTARTVIVGQSYGTFSKPPELGVSRIPMPTVADLNRLDSLATVGGTRFAGSMAGGPGQARTRIEFVTIDLGGSDGPQGFFRVYQGTDEAFVSASLPAGPNYLRDSRNCGDVVAGVFLAAAYHDSATSNAAHRHFTSSLANRRDSALIASPGGNPAGNPARTGVRCYLGGDSILTRSGTGASWPTSGHPDGGQWVPAPAPINAALAALPALAGRPDRNYLFPLNRAWNPDFKGVIYVAGKVLVSGVIHGRVTVAAAGNIVFGDDIQYFQNPATRDCTTGDIAGYFSGQSLVVANNTINAPQTTNTAMSVSPGTTSLAGVRSYDDTRDETIHGFFLTLKSFGVEQYDMGNQRAEPCLIGGTFNVGRGCLNTYGGIIQGNRGAVGLLSGTGYTKRYQYDPCGATDPPPYFPTTGVFVKNRFYEMDPVRFNVAAWFAANQL